MIILPRQAQDKHRENSKKDAVFRTCTAQNSLSLLLVPAEHTAVQQSLMFVPSLSWQPIPLLYSTYENDANNGVFFRTPARVGPDARALCAFEMFDIEAGSVARDRETILRQNGFSFLSFPYVCPEPVLVKCSFYI